MSQFLKNPAFPTRNAQSDGVRQLLGLAPKAKLPKEGMGTRVIQGIEVWIIPASVGRKSHRVLAKCPDCGKVLSAGRLHQHICKEGR